jgi:hypothetical protein
MDEAEGMVGKRLDEHSAEKGLFAGSAHWRRGTVIGNGALNASSWSHHPSTRWPISREGDSTFRPADVSALNHRSLTPSSEAVGRATYSHLKVHERLTKTRLW